jgi:hypothetical protein
LLYNDIFRSSEKEEIFNEGLILMK